MVAIGSRALKYWYPETREPKDYDVIGYEQELATYVKENYLQIKSCRSSRPGKYMIRLHCGKSIEFEVQDGNSNFGSCYQITSVTKQGPVVTYSEVNLTAHICSPQVLLAIKKSHLFVPLKQWKKHMEDYHFLLSKLSTNRVLSEIQLIVVLRSREAQDRMTKMSAKLNMTNEQFFAKSEAGVKRIYVHDDLHRSTCYYKNPLFTKIKVDQNLATCDETLFNGLPLPDQIRAVREEAFSIALERKVIPLIEANQEVNAHEALQYALFRICTTLTSGWFRSFAQDHYYEILNSDVDYVAKFKLAVSSGIITRKEL